MAEPTEAELTWSDAVRGLYVERVRRFIPAERLDDFGPEEWEQARAAHDAQDPNLGRDFASTIDYLGDLSWEHEPFIEGPGTARRNVFVDDFEYTSEPDESGPVDEPQRIDGADRDADLDLISELRAEAASLAWSAQLARDAGAEPEAAREADRARVVSLAADELALDVDSASGRTPDAAHVAAEREWIRASTEHARLTAQPFLPAAPLIASPGRRREAEQALDERVAGHVEWAHALRAVHFQRAQAEWRRLVRDGAEPSDELAVRAREGVHLRDRKLAALVPISTDTLRREGQLPVRDTAPPAELRERHAALTRRIEEASYFWERTGASDAESVAEMSALRSAADDLALSEGYPPEAFAANADESGQPPAPRRRRVIDLLPKLPRPPARPTPESVTQQSASTRGPSSGPHLY